MKNEINFLWIDTLYVINKLIKERKNDQNWFKNFLTTEDFISINERVAELLEQLGQSGYPHQAVKVGTTYLSNFINNDQFL